MILEHLTNVFGQQHKQLVCSTNTFVSSTGVNSIGSKSLTSTNIYVDYIYLDTEERRRFSSVAHEYLIEQLQFTGEENINASSNSIKINFTHPVKKLVWVIQPTNFVQKDYSQSRVLGRQYFNFTDTLYKFLVVHQNHHQDLD